MESTRLMRCWTLILFLVGMALAAADDTLALDRGDDLRELFHDNDNDNENENENGTEQSLHANPFQCTISSKAKNHCLHLSHCAWCQGEGLPGICTSEDQAKKLIDKLPKVHCEFAPTVLRGSPTTITATTTTTTTAMTTTTESKSSHDDDNTLSKGSMAPYDLKCLNAPYGADSEDEQRDLCNRTTDSSNDTMCVWCNGAGVLDLCLSHDQAVAAASYLDCDLEPTGSTSTSTSASSSIH